MAVKIAELLKSLAKKAGIDIADAKFADAFKFDSELPDEIASAIETGLMNEAAAISNTKIKNKIRAEVYNGIDSDFESSLDEFELADDVKQTVLGEKKTIDRVKKLSAHLKEQATKAGKAGDKTKEEALTKQVEQLNNDIKALKDNSKKEVDQLKADNENNIIGFSMKSKLGSKQFVLPEQMSADEKVEFAFNMIMQDLTQGGLKVIRENGSTRLIKADGTDYYDDKNNKVELDNYVDSSLSKRGLLKVSDSPAGPASNAQQQTPQTVSGAGAVTLPQSSLNAISEIDKMIDEASKRQ